MSRTFYTINDLYQFCKANNFTKFSSQEHDGKPLIIQSFETFKAEDVSKDGLLPVHLAACHLNKNRNGSGITEEVMKKNMNSFKGRPILGAIYKTDTGDYEFRSHDVKLVENDNEVEVEYIEQPVGVISEIIDPYLEYNKEQDKTYLMVSGNIFEDYSRAAEIMQRRKTAKCSVEIAVNEMSWNADEDYLSIDDFCFRGVTILGYEQDGVTEIEEGMVGSKITIDSFSEKNSMFSATIQDKLLETLDKLNATLSKFSIENAKTKGVEKEMNHFEELLEAYELTAEDIDFEVDGLSDEELDALFEEHFGCKKKKKYEDEAGEDEGSGDPGNGTGGEEPTDPEDGGEDPDPEPEEPDTPDEDDEPEVDDGKSKKRQYSVAEDGSVTLTCELSHDDIRSGIYQLLYAENMEYTWIIEVFDNKFIYQDYIENKFYKRGYSKDGNNISLGDDKVEVFSEWLTQEEKDAIASLKADYAALKEFKEGIEATELQSKKDEIFAREEYAVLVEDEAFIALKKDAEKYSLEEVEAKCKVIFADHVMKTGKFAFEKKDDKKSTKIGINFNAPTKKKTYGNLFDK